MTASDRPAGYSSMQVILHWVIAALVIFQLFFGDLIGPAYRAFRRGNEIDADMLFDARIHAYAGIAVLVLAIWRFAIRLTRGVPPAPAGESRVAEWTARITHFLLYVVIFGMPISGMIAWYAGVEQAGEVHEAAKLVIFVVVGLHILGALWQQFFAKSGALMRMLVPERRAG